jgi:hypothetical protein
VSSRPNIFGSFSPQKVHRPIHQRRSIDPREGDKRDGEANSCTRPALSNRKTKFIIKNASTYMTPGIRSASIGASTQMAMLTNEQKPAL